MDRMKRKPMSDITNKYNLIPTSQLRKLVAAASTSNLAKPPLSIAKSNSNSSSQKFVYESSCRSNASIGSSNVSNATFKPKIIDQFRSPPPVISSITSPSGIGKKDAARNVRQIIEKSRKETEADLIVRHTPAVRRKDKGKTIAVTFSSPPSKKMMDHQNDIFKCSTSFERQKQSGISNHSLSTGSVDMVKQLKKGIHHSYGRSFEKAKIEKGKSILSSSACALGKRREIGKSISGNSSCSLEKSNYGNEGILKHSRSSNLIIKEMGQETHNPSGFLVQRAKDKGTAPNSLNSSCQKGKEILQPSHIDEIEHEGSSGAVIVKSGYLVEREKDKRKSLEVSSAAEAVRFRPLRNSEKRKFDAGASSCPPMMKLKSMENDLDEARIVKSSKSWTDPHLKRKKKTTSRIEKISELPRDFIQQQKAYFKEIDEFELMEEEVSSDDLE